ncbi:P2X purinoceptor 2-like [Corythoichthys intestinalis]|uniref:P2X purinoceptor 2-like n=1 Tax=Corythoichthys intestinalis TaxID=161448 RepID=UPI0025A4CE86|nr:P2X purinoceptor 2-like [Corythoichthys intestinalis]XP_061804114.1 P2X purinoceptor 2-like [Nerophis lumbriciformis]
MGFTSCLKDYFLGFWDYETPKIMVVKNMTLGVIYRVVQFIVITYFVWYVFISQKAYQESETRPQSSVYTRMKGSAVRGDEILDTVEYVRPSEGGDVISAILRREVTDGQKQGTCAEYFGVTNANCTSDSDCIKGEVDFNGNGRRTGRCIQYYNHTFKTCEIQTWCPIEDYAVKREPSLVEAINFTLFIRNSIYFPKFGALRGNIKDASNRRTMHKYLNKCLYDEEKEPYCPNFRLGYIAHQARENFTELCRTGGVIGVFIHWDCDLDLDLSRCKPKYSFRRLDVRKDQANSGYYCRFSKYYQKDGVESRTLIKAYGIRLDVIVHGQAGKFSPIPTIISTVTALTSVGICTIICDWIMLTFLDKDDVYSESKFDEVIDEPTEFIPPQLLYITSFSSYQSDLSDGVPL